MAIRSIPGEGRELELFYCNTFLDFFFSPYLLVGCGIYWKSFSFPPKSNHDTNTSWMGVYILESSGKKDQNTRYN